MILVYSFQIFEIQQLYRDKILIVFKETGNLLEVYIESDSLLLLEKSNLWCKEMTLSGWYFC